MLLWNIFSWTPSVLSWLWPASIKIIYGRALPLVGEYPAPHAAVPRVARGSSAVGWSVQHQCRIRQHPETGEEAVSHGTQASVRKKNPTWIYILTPPESGGVGQALVLTCSRREQMQPLSERGIARGGWRRERLLAANASLRRVDRVEDPFAVLPLHL